MNRFLKILAIINGLIIPVFIGYLIYKSLTDEQDYYSYQTDSLIVGEDLEQALSDSLALQGLGYDIPVWIGNSSNFYLPISVMTFQEAKDLRRDIESAGDISLSFYNYTNVVFLDQDYKVIGKLLDKSASISDIQSNYRGLYYAEEEDLSNTVTHIVYQIAFEDTNGDNRLNSLDDHDLYVSDLSGRNLVRVTSGKDVMNFSFIKKSTELLVKYKDRSDIRDEHRFVKFGIYNFENSLFRELKDLESTLKEIESIVQK
jgi:hypothetical protein